VIAEGVETEEQYNFLRDHDCDEMQGYVSASPSTRRRWCACFPGQAASTNPHRLEPRAAGACLPAPMG